MKDFKRNIYTDEIEDFIVDNFKEIKVEKYEITY